MKFISRQFKIILFHHLALRDTLSENGSLDSVRAQIRASIFNALEDKGTRRPKPLARWFFRSPIPTLEEEFISVDFFFFLSFSFLNFHLIETWQWGASDQRAHSGISRLQWIQVRLGRSHGGKWHAGNPHGQARIASNLKMSFENFESETFFFFFGSRRVVASELRIEENETSRQIPLL